MEDFNDFDDQDLIDELIIDVWAAVIHQGELRNTAWKRFQAATTSMRQWLRVMGVTVVSEENQYFPARMVSSRRLGRTKSIVVVMDSASAYSRSNL